MRSMKGLPTGVVVGLMFAGAAWLITGMPSAAVIFGVVFGGVIFGVVRYQALYAKRGASGVDGSSDADADDDTSIHDSSWSSWMSSASNSPARDDTDCADTGSDSSSDDGGSCDSGGGDGGGGGGD